MIEAVLYMAAGSLGTLALLAFYACWVAYHEDDDRRHR